MDSSTKHHQLRTENRHKTKGKLRNGRWKAEVVGPKVSGNMSNMDIMQSKSKSRTSRYSDQNSDDKNNQAHKWQANKRESFQIEMKMVLPYNFQQTSLSNSKSPCQTQRSGAGVICTNNPYGKKHGFTGAETTRGGTIDALQFKDQPRDGVSTTHQNISVRKTNYFEQ